MVDDGIGPRIVRLFVAGRMCLAALVLTPLLAVGCADGESPVLDLVELAQRMPLRAEAFLEFDAGDRRLGLIGDGWSDPETSGDGLTFTWAIGRRAEVSLPVLGEERRWLHLRCRPFDWPGADPQTMRVRLNGTPVGDLELAPGFRPYTLEVPAAALRVGDNVVELTFGRATRPSERLPNSNDSRLLAAAFDYVELSVRPDFVPPDAGVTPVVLVHSGDVVQPPRTELAIGLSVPADGVLAFGVVGERGSGGGGDTTKARIVARRADGTEVELFQSMVGADTRIDQRVALDPFVGERIDLVFQALAGANDARLRWRRPQLLGSAPALDLATNVLLIVVDTLRADALSCYGGSTPTPNLDALAASGVRFARAYSHAPMTGPSHASLFTSLIPTEHGVRNNIQILHDRHVTLAELLRDAYRRTAAFVSLGVLNARFGTAQGFGEYEGVTGLDWWRPAGAVNAGVLPWLERHGATPFFLWAHYSDPHEPYTPPGRTYPSMTVKGSQGESFTVAIDASTRIVTVEVPPGTHDLRMAAGSPSPAADLLLRSVRATPADVAIECGEGCEPSLRDGHRAELALHLPGSLRLVNTTGSSVRTEIAMRAQEARSADEARALYLEEVAYVDAEVGRLLDTLRREGRADDTLIVFTSDHGEGLGDHDLLGHVHQLYDTLVSVPLILSLPGRLPAGTVVETPVGHVDVLPTIVDLLGISDPVHRTGRSLLQFIEPGASADPLFSETWRPEAERDLQAVVDGRYKLIRTLADTPRVELYDLRADPGELDDLGPGSESARRLLGLLEVRMGEARLRGIVAEEGELSDEDLERLRALGYVR